MPGESIRVTRTSSCRSRRSSSARRARAGRAASTRRRRRRASRRSSTSSAPRRSPTRRSGASWRAPGPCCARSRRTSGASRGTASSRSSGSSRSCEKRCASRASAGRRSRRRQSVERRLDEKRRRSRLKRLRASRRRLSLGSGVGEPSSSSCRCSASRRRLDARSVLEPVEGPWQLSRQHLGEAEARASSSVPRCRRAFRSSCDRRLPTSGRVARRGRRPAIPVHAAAGREARQVERASGRRPVRRKRTSIGSPGSARCCPCARNGAFCLARSARSSSVAAHARRRSRGRRRHRSPTSLSSKRIAAWHRPVPGRRPRPRVPANSREIDVVLARRGSRRRNQRSLCGSRSSHASRRRRAC